MKNVRIFDNQGETFDRYTVLIDNEIYGMSHNPLSPQGFNQYCGELTSDINFDCLGEEITEQYLSLPHKVFVAIHQRVNPDMY